MTIDPRDVQPAEAYRMLTSAVTPRPIGWVSTVSPRGVANLAPYSFFNAVGANPPAVMFSPTNRRDGSPKDSLLNARSTRQFVVNIVSDALAERMNATSRELPYEVSEFEAVGLTPVPSVRVRPPRVAEAAVHIECEVMHIVPVGEGPLAGNIVIGRVLLLHVADDLLGPDGLIDPGKLDAVGRMGGSWYSRTRDRFELHRPT
ncbi:MAG: flavin reductase family protein [Tepidisphaerales bacterium]